MLMIARLKKLLNGIYTPKEMLLFIADGIRRKIFRVPSRLYVEAHARRVLKPEGGVYHIKDVRLPALDPVTEGSFLAVEFEDTFHSYVYCDDKYDEATFDRCDKFLGEGLYGLVNDKVNVTVEAGDIVIDAGSWIGDFAAYASAKGATCYAFEPADVNFTMLQKTAGLNRNIIPVKKGLSDENTSRNLFVDPSHYSGSSFLEELKPGFEGTQVETVRLDDFVRENNLPRVDFIKCDIEGFERHMLEGAQETLARFAPKLALCTYHLPDDPQVMEALIKKANPKYNVVQKRKKLFASVPQE